MLGLCNPLPSPSCPTTSLSPPLCCHSICCSSWLGSPSVGTAGKENRAVYFYPQILLRGKGAPSDREAIRGSYGIWEVKGGGQPGAPWEGATDEGCKEQAGLEKAAQDREGAL